jgi:K(+)-stimulated pyrophosphate-energized sodium pump
MVLLDNTPISQVSVGLAGGIVAVIVAIFFFLKITSTVLPTSDDADHVATREAQVKRANDAGKPIGTQKDLQVWYIRVARLQELIHNGAQSFLFAEYFYLAIFCVIIFAALCGVLYTEQTQVHGVLTGICFLVGAILSGTAGYIGMVIATEANSRTAFNCVDSMKAGLEVSFASGAVMSNSVVGFGTLGVLILYLIFSGDANAWQYISGFGFGASSIALFARVGGGIFTKAADVGADLVGKVDSGIPEDDPRNPATIADNVGDNVGDVAGMGADLFESYVGGIIATATLAVSEFPAGDYQNAAIALPFWVSGFGILVSLIGTVIVRTLPLSDSAGLERLLKQINYGIFTASFLVVIMSLISCGVLFGWETDVAYRYFGCVIIGLAAGLVIGHFTEYCTSYETAPTRYISESSRFGTAPVIIMGLGVGMISVTVPTIALSIVVLACNALGGLYGVSLSSVGLLATLGITLATDAYGPVADNAGGIAEMAGMHDSIRTKTDSLDSLGNTTAATGKGFAIGSAVLTAVGLITAFLRSSGLTETKISAALSEPVVLTGVLLGAMLPFIFASLTMLSVNKAAQAIIAEVRAQFSACPKLLTFGEGDDAIYRPHLGVNGKMYPDSDRCVKIATESAVAEMMLPGLLAVFFPVIIGFLLGTLGLAGLLVGALTSGFMLALTMANAGGAWDNAKKWVEKCAKEGEPTGHDHDSPVTFTKFGIKKGGQFSKFDAKSLSSVTQYSPVVRTAAEAATVSAMLVKDELAQNDLKAELLELYHERHSAVVNGDTVGDPFKDTSGPALNILIKLMSIISLVLAPTWKSMNEHRGFGPTGWWIALIIAIVISVFCYIFVSRINAANKASSDKLDEELAAQKLQTWVARAEARNATLAALGDSSVEDVVSHAVDAVADAAVDALVKGVQSAEPPKKAGATSVTAEDKLNLWTNLVDELLPFVESRLGLHLRSAQRAAVAKKAKDILTAEFSAALAASQPAVAAASTEAASTEAAAAPAAAEEPKESEPAAAEAATEEAPATDSADIKTE